ncbi:uncharacterized protein V6R79_025765 [Siganus canaliculatus]
MSRTEAENVIKIIIREIALECARRGAVVSNTLVAFMVKAVVLDPRNGFNVDRTLTKQDVQKIKELCLGKLMESCSPSLDTIKMQVYFGMSYTSRSEFLDDIHRKMQSRLNPLSREITDSRVKTREECHALYRKIVSFILLCSGMGSPTDVNTVKEATAVLQSVFPQAELGVFMALLTRDKEKQLSEFTMIVSGIQLFNKANKAEKEPDLCELIPPVLNEALAVISKSIEKELTTSQSLAWKYTAVLEKLTDPDSQSGEVDMNITTLKQALYNIRQHEDFLKILLADARVCAGHVEILQRELLLHIKLLKENVKSKTAVPTRQVFPAFKALSKLWSRLQDEAELLNILNNIKDNMQPFISSQAKIFSEAYLSSLVEASEVKSDEQRATESSDDHIIPAEMETQEWLLPEETANFNGLQLQYNGVCGHTFVKRDGLLLPGNPHIGILKHKEKLYAFSSKEAALKFASASDDFIDKVAEKAKHAPELIQLLKLHQQFSCLSPYSEMYSGESLQVKPVIKCDSGTQTDIHPVETNIVKSHEWNEWELRRKAIKLADLCKKATHSTQTDQSHMRRMNDTQTWPPKNATCQGKRDGESNVPRPQIYLTGLRGQRGRSVVKTNLTRSIDE